MNVLPANTATTLTVRVIVHTFPAVSVFAYVSTYVPAVLVSTEPDVESGTDPEPSTLSVHDAPRSTKVEPTGRLILLEPERVMIGA